MSCWPSSGKFINFQYVHIFLSTLCFVDCAWFFLLSLILTYIFLGCNCYINFFSRTNVDFGDFASKSINKCRITSCLQYQYLIVIALSIKIYLRKFVTSNPLESLGFISRKLVRVYYSSKK